MCSPSLITMGLQVGGGVIAAKGAEMQGEASSNYYNYLGDMDMMQARILEAEAERKVGYVQDEAARRSALVGQTAKKTLASQVAVGAAAGIGSGSAVMEAIADESSRNATLDEMAIRYNADVASYETKVKGKYEAWGLREKARGEYYSGQNARAAGKMNFWASILGTGSNIFNTWNKFQDVGVK